MKFLVSLAHTFSHTPFPNLLSPIADAIESLQMLLNKHSLTGISLDAAGLIALADLSTIAERTALAGDASWFDIFILAPGIHRQQTAVEINRGELPTTGAINSGYVFRIENQATVAFLQRVGQPGCLTTVQVDGVVGPGNPLARCLRELSSMTNIMTSALYSTGIIMTVVAIVIVGLARDFWALGVLCMLITARLLNTIVIKRRAKLTWKGAPEPGKMGDLVVLLSQDRWVRIQGTVDDLKAVTAGQWLRDETMVESFITAFATLLVYVSAAIAANASSVGSLTTASLLLVSVALLGLSNAFTKHVNMFGRTLRVSHPPKAYHRRLDMAQEMIRISGRDDWAIGMGLILPPTSSAGVKVTV